MTGSEKSPTGIVRKKLPTGAAKSAVGGLSQKMDEGLDQVRLAFQREAQAKQAIAAIKANMAEGLVVRDLDRVTRSIIDGADLLEDAKINGWRLLGAVDGLDTGDPEQEFSTNIKIAVAQEERRKIARRTKDGLATAARNGKKLGKPKQIHPELEARIVRLARKGNSGYKIAQRLTTEGIPTPQGRTVWSPSAVRDVIARNTRGAS